MVAHSPRAFPWEIKPPVGIGHVTGKRRRRARGRRSRPRICLRKGCRRKYQSAVSQPALLSGSGMPAASPPLARGAAAGQTSPGRRRQNPSTPRSEKARRQLAKSASQTVENPKLAPARGHAAETFFSLPLMRSAGLPRTPRELAPQPGTLLLPCLPSGRSECPGS